MIAGLSPYSPGAVAPFRVIAQAAPLQVARWQAAAPLEAVAQSPPALRASPLATGGTLLAAQQQDSQGGARPTAGELSEEEQQLVAKLKQIDAKVRAHERAHAAVGGQYAGTPSYQYTRGPDGQLYATSGEVPIDLSPEGDPEATLQKAEQVAAAALAPAEPSAADRAVAAAAAKLRLEALAQIREEKRVEQEAGRQEAGEANRGPVISIEAQSSPGISAPVPGPDTPAARAAQAYAGQVRADDNAGPLARLGQQVGLTA